MISFQLLVLARGGNSSNTSTLTPSPAPSNAPTQSPSFGSVANGGATCYEDWQCGYTSAQWTLDLATQSADPDQQLSKELISSNGKCESGVCVCEAGFTCSNCAVPVGATKPRCCRLKQGVVTDPGYSDQYCQNVCGLASVSPRSLSCAKNCVCDFNFTASHCVNVCDHQWGGGACERDEQCLNGGMCLGQNSREGGYQGTCSCPVGWGCAFCELPINDLSQKISGKYLQCPGTSTTANSSYISGGSRCTSNADCGTGSCIPPFGGVDCSNPKKGEVCTCQCGSGVGCGDCSKSAADLLSGAASCGCDAVQCPPASDSVVANANGRCNPSTGACDCYWPFTGTDCSVNPCAAERNPCIDMPNAICVVDEVTQQARCECTSGYTGPLCNIRPKCTANSDCGVWGPIPQAAADGLDPNFACSETGLCVEDKFGGTCDLVTGTCKCNAGFSCPNTCTTRGDAAAAAATPGSCFLGTGGGVCTSDTQCQRLGKVNYCFKGRCVCSNGFTCPLCDFAQQSIGKNQSCPVPPADLGQYSQVPGPAPTAPPTLNYDLCGENSQWIYAEDASSWYKGSAKTLCVCLSGYYAIGAKIPTVTSGSRSYPDISGNKPYTEMFGGSGSITCKRCPSNVQRKTCLDADKANWQKYTSTSSDSTDAGELSSGALTGAVIGGIVGVGLLAYGAMMLMAGRGRHGAFKGRPARSLQMPTRAPKGMV